MQHARWFIAAAVVTTAPATATLARADCAAIPMKSRPIQLEVVVLGRYLDLVGNPAAFYFDKTGARVIGPIDKPTGTAKPGQAGTLTFRALVPTSATPGGTAPTVGFFTAFAPRGAPGPLDPLLPAITDPFALGLLAGDSPVATAAAARVALLDGPGDGREQLASAMQGVLYAAPAARAQALFAGYHYEELASADPSWLVVLKHEGVAGLARRAAHPTADRSSWADYLPDLAAAWLKRPGGDLNAALDASLLGHELFADPIFESDADPENPFRRGCGPTRQQIRGPFRGPGELGGHVLLELLARADVKFAAAVKRAFRGVTALSAAVVLDVGVRGARRRVVVTHGGSLLAVDTSAQEAAGLGRGTRVAFVARRALGASEMDPVPHLAETESTIESAGVAKLVKAGPVDATALVTTLRDEVRSGATAYSAGPALATLFDLVGSGGGWDLAAFRAAIWSLPGNSYDTPAAWASAWHEILEKALQFSTNPAFAAEVEHALPGLVQQMARTTRGPRAATIPGDIVRAFALEVAAPLALLRVRAGDLAGADRGLALATGPLAAIAGPGVKLDPETQPTSYLAAGARVVRVMVRGLQKKSAADVRASTPDAVSYDLDTFVTIARPYARSLRVAWAAALVTAGYPKPPADD